MFEEDHPQSPADPTPKKKRVGTAVMLAAGGVVVATLFATVASMLAASGKEASQEPQSVDVVETITSVAPDGSTSTVLVTVPSSAGKPPATPDRKQAARPNEQPKPGVVETPQLTSNPAQPSQPQSNPPTSWSEPPSSSSSTTSSTTTPPSSSSSSTSAPAPKP